jgi:excinuclease ABC subunit A
MSTTATPRPALDAIEVYGAREHNLQNVTLRIPKRRLVVLTGPSGSGKSSLAFDTIYVEGQRRYVESLSAYARQFLGTMSKPDFDSLQGLSPTISIKQKSTAVNPRSTVGTITEIHDYLRVLFARMGELHRAEGDDQPNTPEAIADAILALPEGARLLLLAPLVRNRKGEWKDLFTDLIKEGFVRAKVNGEVVELTEGMSVSKVKRHNIDAVVDRLVVRADSRGRLLESLQRALKRGEGSCEVEVVDGPTLSFSVREAPVLSPQHFSYNSPLGMCPECQGLGQLQQMDAARVVPDDGVSIAKGALAPMGGADDKEGSWGWEILMAACEALEIDVEMPWGLILPEKRHALLFGIDQKIEVQWKRKNKKSTWKTDYEGLLPQLMRRYQETSSEKMREHYGQFLSSVTCQVCEGTRLHPERRQIKVLGRDIGAVGGDTIDAALGWVEGLRFVGSQAVVGEELVREIAPRLRFLIEIGLGYLSLDRPGPSLSGGELQRIRLASQLGSELSGVLYVLDEPSIGLHQRDNHRLLGTLKALRDRGNSVLVVEHDADTMAEADWILDFGPGAGRHGGHVVAQGTPAQIRENPESLTGRYLSGSWRLEPPARRRAGHGTALTVRGARANNLRGVDVSFPLGTFTCVTGVSGAGKSSLIHQILCPALGHALNRAGSPDRTLFDGIDGLEHLDKLIEIDQSPIGRTPRSNPSTYTKLFDEIRAVFANLPTARMYGYDKGRFSFNVAGGRCEECQGAGRLKLEMSFLADVYVPCQSCRGRRFNDATLKVTYRGLSITDVLELSAEDAIGVFGAHPRIARVLQTLVDVGLGYVQLGQSSTTLSGGEAQRVKLSRELARAATGKTIYVMDEPSTGLHFDDIQKLLKVVQRLVDAGNTVLMIEHNLDIIYTADHVVDIGPEGGGAGGLLVAQGTPEEVAGCAGSITGQYLARMRP